MDFSKERSDFFKVVILLGLSAIAVVSLMYVTIPLIPVWSHTFHATQKQVVWAGSAFGFAYAIGNVCFGTLSDRVRRIHILYVGLFLLSISTALVGFSPSLGWLIILRTIQGIVASSFPAVALAYVGDVLAPRYRPIAISVISCGFLLAGVFGQIYAGGGMAYLKSLPFVI
jgi:YNFM family putative membrane transporter